MYPFDFTRDCPKCAKTLPKMSKKKTLAKSFNSSLITDKNYLENLKKRFKDSYKNSNGNRSDKIDDMIAYLKSLK